ncbi:MAG TPA: S8 family serine peptidase, partial [Anaerolineales bacterium]|nr:S8 family serine peptidase [Anaerolineales bacterium]
MSNPFRFLTLMLIFALSTVSLGNPLVANRAVAAQWEQKVDPWVLQTAAGQSETEFLVFLAEQADLSATEAMQTKLEKGTYVYETLTALAEHTQKPVIAQLEGLGVEYRSFWVANMIWVRGNSTIAQTMAQRADVAHVFANPVVPFEALPEEEKEALLSPDTVEWNIAMVNADDVWAEGVTGQGAVIGGQDTGYDWDHPALIDQYRGWDGANANHSYNWHDAIHSGGGSCGPDSPEPCDDYGHGTHTMGIMIGDDGGTNQIGMAPGAQWIGCRNMDQGNGTPATYSECYQWFIAPTDLNDENPDPSKAPDVINNSWGCPVSEGCTDPNVLLAVVQAVRAAGILTAHSAGNSGAGGCGTVNTPSAIYGESFTVGSTTNTNTLSGFSSRGPVTVDGSNRLKPDISAPGSGIRSSLRGGGYGGMSGTSMAAPHVAGLVGLLISANPALAGQVDLVEDIIEQTAVPVTVSPVQTCGGIPSTEIPNNTFGWGRMDAYA